MLPAHAGDRSMPACDDGDCGNGSSEHHFAQIDVPSAAKDSGHVSANATPSRDLANPTHAQPGSLRNSNERPPLQSELTNCISAYLRDTLELEVQLREEVIHGTHYDLGVAKRCQPLDLSGESLLELG